MKKKKQVAKRATIAYLRASMKSHQYIFDSSYVREQVWKSADSIFSIISTWRYFLDSQC